MKIDKSVIGILQKANVDPSVIQKVQSRFVEAAIGPALGRDVVFRIRQTAADFGSAIVVLGKERQYRVYSPAGYDAIVKNGEKRGQQFSARARGELPLDTAGAK